MDRTKHDVFSLGVIIFEASPNTQCPFPYRQQGDSVHPCPSPSSTSLASSACCTQALN